MAKEKWPNIFDEEESNRMLGYVKDVYAALEARVRLNLAKIDKDDWSY